MFLFVFFFTPVSGSSTGGLFCYWDAWWTPVLTAGHGLRNHQDQGHRQKGQWWRMVPCWLPERRTLRYNRSSFNSEANSKSWTDSSCAHFEASSRLTWPFLQPSAFCMYLIHLFLLNLTLRGFILTILTQFIYSRSVKFIVHVLV